MPSLKRTESSLSCVSCFLYLVSSSINVSIFLLHGWIPSEQTLYIYIYMYMYRRMSIYIYIYFTPHPRTCSLIFRERGRENKRDRKEWGRGGEREREISV